MRCLLLLGILFFNSYLLKAQTVHELKGVEILSDMARYKRDSAAMDTIYRKRFSDAKQKVTVDLSNGLVAHGLVSHFASAVSGMKKRDKRFLQEYQRMQSEKIIAIRYNPAIVSAVTKLKGDSLGIFMNSYPMEEAFSRTASELELKMWIRHNYKLWLDKSKQSQ